MEKIEKYMKQTLKNKVKITKAAIIAILITGGIAAPKIARADTPNEKAGAANENHYQYYITTENEKHGLELGDNSQARGTGSIVTSENGMATGKGAVATGGDNTSKEDIERKLRENQDKLNEIDSLKKTNVELTNQLSDLQQKEQDVIQAGIRVEQIRKARANAEKEAQRLRNSWQTEVDGSKEFFKNYQAKIDDLNSRLTGVRKLKNNNIQTPEGLEKAVDEFKHNVEDGTNLNLSRDFYKDYITSYYKALGDLRLNKILYNSIGTSNILVNGKENTIKNIIDANFFKRDLKDIVIPYWIHSNSSSSSGQVDNNSSFSYSNDSNSFSDSYNLPGEYSVDKNGIGRVVGDDSNGGYQRYNGKLIKTVKNIDVDLTNQEDYDLWKSVKDGWKNQIHDAGRRAGSEFFGKFDTLTNGKSTILFNMVTDMKFELIDLDYEITHDQWKYEQTHDTRWLDKKRECLDKRQQKLDTNEKILKDKYMELFGEKLENPDRLFGTINAKFKKEWKKENIDDFENKNKITTEKLTSELEKALGVNKNAIKERQEKLDRMKSEYEQAERNAKGLKPSKKDLILSREYKRVKAEIEQMTNTLKTNQERLKALKEALTLYDLKNKGKDNIAYGTDTLAVGDNAIAFGKGTKTVGENSISFGVDLLTTGNNNTNVGQLSQVTGEKNQVVGFSNEVKGDQNLVFGNNNRVISNGEVSSIAKVTFIDRNDKDHIMYVPKHTTLKELPNPSVPNKGFVFKEWNLDRTGTGTIVTKDTVVDNDMIVYQINDKMKPMRFDPHATINTHGKAMGTLLSTPTLDLKDREIKVGEKLDLNSLVFSAHDDTDGDLKNQVKVISVINTQDGKKYEFDNNTFVGNVVGTYGVTYEVKNKYGATIHKQNTITVTTTPTKTYNVTFVSDDGNKETVTVNDGDSLESTHLLGKYSSYNKPGYVFWEFSTDKHGNTEITTKTPIHQDTKVYTIWKPIPTELSYNSESYSNISYKYNINQEGVPYSKKLDELLPETTHAKNGDKVNPVLPRITEFTDNGYKYTFVGYTSKESIVNGNYVFVGQWRAEKIGKPELDPKPTSSATPNPSATPTPDVEPTPQPHESEINMNKSSLNSEVSDDNDFKMSSSYMVASKELQNLYDDVMEEAKAILNDPNGDISHLSKLKQLSDRLRSIEPNHSDDDVENNMIDNANNDIERKIDNLIKLSEDVIGQANHLGTHADRSTSSSSRVRRRRSVDANPSESTPKTMTPIINENILQGNRNEVFGNGNIVFGSENKVGTETKGVMNNILFGNKIDATNVNNAIVFGNESKPIEGAVSFGNDTTTRQLKFVSKGTDDTDAVNFSQLKDYVKKHAKGKTVNIKNELLSKLNYDPDTYLKIDKTYLQYIVDEKGNIKIPDTKKLSLNIDGVKDALGKDSDIANPKDKFVTDKKVHDYVTTNFVSKDSLDVTKLLKSSDVDVTGDEYINVSKDKNKYALSLNKDKLASNLDLSKNTAITTIKDELKTKADLDASNVKDTYLTNWQSVLGNGAITDGNKGLINGGTVFTYVNNIKQQLSTKASQDLAKKLNIDADNLSKTGVTNLTNKLGVGAITENNGGLVTGGVVKTYVDDQIKNNLGTINTSLSSKLSDITISGDKYITVNKVNNSKYTLTLNEDALNTHLNSYDFKNNTTIQTINNNIKGIDDKKANINASNVGDAGVTAWQNKLGNGEVKEGNTGLVNGGVVKTYVDSKIDTNTNIINTKLDKKLDKDGLEVKGDDTYITVTPSDDKGKKTYTVKFDDSKLTETIKGSDFTSNKSIQDMLDKKANLDAGNVTGDNLTKWQATLGNGTIDANDTGLVTGGTVYNYINPIKTQVDQLGTDLNGKLSDITINGDKYIKTEKAGKGVYNLSLNEDTLETLINSKTADLAKNDAITNINKELEKKANKDAGNLEDKDVENWQAKLGTGSVAKGDTKLVKGDTVFTYVNNSINTIKQELSTKATEDLAKKLDIDANNLNDTGVTNLTKALGKGEIKDNDNNLVTGGTVKAYITDEINDINTKISGKLSSKDVDVKGDDYITVNKDVQKPNHYSLVFNKEQLATDLDLSKNTKLNEKFGKYALLDGSNLESNEFNLNVWQAKLGNGTITSGNTGLVKGGDIFTYVNNIKQELNNQATQDLSNKLDKDGSNLDKDSLDKLTNKLSEESNLTTPTNRLVTDTKVSESLEGKLDVDANNLTKDGITNLTTKLGIGEVAENNAGLITGGKVYEVKKELTNNISTNTQNITELGNKYNTLNNQVTTNTKDISKLKTDVEDLKNTKQDITKINNKLGDIDNSITNINTKLDGKLDKTDLSIKGDKYIGVKKDNKFNYTLSFNKTKLENDLDLTNNNSINNMFTTKLGDINTNIGDLKASVETNTNSINSLTTKVDGNTNKITDLTNKVDTNTNDITTLKQDITKKLNVDADNLTTKGETNLINKLSKGSDISKPNNKLVTDTQVNNFLNDKFKNFSSIDNKVINTLQQGITVVNNKADLALAKSDLALNGISNAVAMANLPQVASYGKYKHMLTAAYGNYAGVNALALGLSGTTDSRRITYKISGSVNTKGNLAFGTGIGVMLGEIHDGNIDTPSHVKEQLIKSEKERQLMRTALINQQNKAKQQEDQIKDLYRIIGELQNQLKKNK